MTVRVEESLNALFFYFGKIHVIMDIIIVFEEVFMLKDLPICKCTLLNLSKGIKGKRKVVLLSMLLLN